MMTICTSCSRRNIEDTIVEIYVIKSTLIYTTTVYICYTDMNALQSLASIKRFISNMCHAVRNIYALQSSTFLKRAISNMCYAVRNVNALQRFTIVKCYITNMCHSIGNVNTLKSIAFVKSSIINMCYAVRSSILTAIFCSWIANNLC